MALITVTVPVELRDQINHDARERGVSAAGLIERLLDGDERRQRMEALTGRAGQTTGVSRQTRSVIQP